MLLRILRFVGGSMACIALANSAWAANVETLAESATVGGEFRAEWMQTNNGLMKTDDFTPSSDSWLDVQQANLKLWGKINKDTEYKFRFSLINGEAGKPALLEGYGSHSFGMFGWTIGRQQVHQGGHDNWNETQGQHAMGVYTNGWAFSKFADALTFNLNVAGTVSLQLVNDVTTANTGSWNKQMHPTYIVSWHGAFGGIQPLVHVGTYDNQKSMYFDIGIKAEMAGLNAYLDFSQNTRNRKGTNADGDTEEFKDVGTAITLFAGYEIKKTAMPWIYFSSYDVKQHDDKDLGQVDAEGNAAIGGAANTAAQEAWEKAGRTWDNAAYFTDNGVVWGLGADLKMFGDNWAPYLALVNRSGKFYEADGSDKTETKSEMMIKLGAYGSI